MSDYAAYDEEEAEAERELNEMSDYTEEESNAPDEKLDNFKVLKEATAKLKILEGTNPKINAGQTRTRWRGRRGSSSRTSSCATSS